jgi:hypothetical protein
MPIVSNDALSSLQIILSRGCFSFAGNVQSSNAHDIGCKRPA